MTINYQELLSSISWAYQYYIHSREAQAFVDGEIHALFLFGYLTLEEHDFANNENMLMYELNKNSDNDD